MAVTAPTTASVTMADVKPMALSPASDGEPMSLDSESETASATTTDSTYGTIMKWSPPWIQPCDLCLDLRPIIISGGPGVGKTRLIRMVCRKHGEDYAAAPTLTTRLPRRGERRVGVTQVLVSRTVFEFLIVLGAFVEWTRVGDDYHGTTKRAVEELQDAGKIVLVEVAARNVQQAKKALDGRSVFLLPPTLDELEDRIRRSGIGDAALIQEMVAQARDDSEYAQEAPEWVFEHFVVNAELVKAFWRVEDFLTEQ